MVGVLDDAILEDVVEDTTLDEVGLEEVTDDTAFEEVGTSDETGVSDEVILSVFEDVVSLDEVAVRELVSEVLLCVLYCRSTDEFPSVSSSSAQPKSPTNKVKHNNINSILFIIPLLCYK